MFITCCFVTNLVSFCKNTKKNFGFVAGSDDDANLRCLRKQVFVCVYVYRVGAPKHSTSIGNVRLVFARVELLFIMYVAYSTASPKI